MSYLLLVRHGESRWNIANKFTGWADVPLTENGMQEAVRVALQIKTLRLDVAFSSHLERAHQTLHSILSVQHCTGVMQHDHSHELAGRTLRYLVRLGENEIPIYTNWLLNERHYGALQGMDKNVAQGRYGHNKVLAWRRGYDARPPRGESLADVYARAVPYFKKTILSEIKKGRNVLVVAHGNTLRAIIKYIEEISDDDISNLEIAPAHPFIYKYEDGQFSKTKNGYSFDRPILWK